MKLANTENVNLFQDIYQYIPTDRFAALKIFDNLLHIIHKSMFKQKFSSNIKIWFDCFDARMIYSTITCV